MRAASVGHCRPLAGPDEGWTHAVKLPGGPAFFHSSSELRTATSRLATLRANNLQRHPGSDCVLTAASEDPQAQGDTCHSAEGSREML